MFCALSNVVPTDPVVSSKSGHLYERSVIMKHLATEAKDPVSGEEMSADDLISIKTPSTVVPRTTTATSVPGLLSLLQSEWDAIMLETYTLREHLNTVRQELSQALYQHDAACRVIARLTRERDSAREQVQRFLSSHAAAGDVDMGDGKEGIPTSVMMKITTLSDSLTAGRKKRPTAAGQAGKAQLSAYKESSSNKLHQTSKGAINCVATSVINPDMIVTGGVDKNVLLFDRSAGKVTTRFTGHSGKVNAVAFHNTSDRIVSASADSTVKVWRSNGDMASSFSPSSSEVVDFSIHPSGDYLLSCGGASFEFCDLNAARGFTSTGTDAGVNAIKFHPDGVLFATGDAANACSIWDLRTLKTAASCDGHSAGVTSLAFSENGYHMASTGEDNTLRVWDLRTCTELRNVALPAAGNSVAFDSSGKFVAVGSSDVKVLVAKSGKLLNEYSSHGSAVSAVAFGHAAKFVVSASQDKTLKIYN